MPKFLKIALISATAIIVIITAVLIVYSLTRNSTDDNANTVPVQNTNMTNTVANVVTNTEPTNTNATNTVTNAVANTNTVVPATTEEQTRQLIRSNAVSFAQIFGSYSTHQPYENVSSARILMSASLKKWADGILEDHEDDSPASAYFGVETYALKTVIADLDSDSASVTVSTQRRESVGSSANKRVFYQDLELAFVKEQGVWKVDNATWIE